MIIIIIAAFGASVYAMYRDAQQWALFAAEHDCKVIHRVKGDTIVGTGIGVTTSGTVGTVTTITATPDKTAYVCDDGVTYWR